MRTKRVSIYSLNNIVIMSYIDNEILERLIGTMVEGFARIEKKLDQMNRLKECMNGDKLLDNVDLAELLGVSQRTLARYRQEGKIKYYSVEKNGKSFYLASEIQSFLLRDCGHFQCLQIDIGTAIQCFSFLEHSP